MKKKDLLLASFSDQLKKTELKAINGGEEPGLTRRAYNTQTLNGIETDYRPDQDDPQD